MSSTNANYIVPAGNNSSPRHPKIKVEVLPPPFIPQHLFGLSGVGARNVNPGAWEADSPCRIVLDVDVWNQIRYGFQATLFELLAAGPWGIGMAGMIPFSFLYPHLPRPKECTSSSLMATRTLVSTSSRRLECNIQVLYVMRGARIIFVDGKQS